MGEQLQSLEKEKRSLRNWIPGSIRRKVNKQTWVDFRNPRRGNKFIKLF